MNNLNLTKLKDNQLRKIDGGISKWTPWGFAAWAAYEIKENWSDIKSGITDAYNDVTKNL